MNLITGVTLGIALVGAVLGVINTVHSLNRDRIILRVIPQWMIMPNALLLGVEIVNLSYIAVGIEETGFSLSKRKRGERIPFMNPVVLDGGAFQRVLQPRSSMTVFVPQQIPISEEFKNVKCAYVRTSCGLIFRGSSRALKQAVHEAKMKNRGSNA